MATNRRLVSPSSRPLCARLSSLVLASSLWPVNTALEVSLCTRPTEELASLKIKNICLRIDFNSDL